MKTRAFLWSLAVLAAGAPAVCAQGPSVRLVTNPTRTSEERVAELKRPHFGLFIRWSLSTFFGKECAPGITNLFSLNIIL